MSTLMTEWRHPPDHGDGQESLFGTDLWEVEAFEASLVEPYAEPIAPTEMPVHDGGEELEALERVTEAPRAPLAGPTLDDVMSRAWEGLTTGLPAACPVCHGEVVPATRAPLSGRCTSCGTLIE